MLIDIHNIARTKDLAVCSEPEAREAFGCGNAVLFQSAVPCDCGNELCPRCATERKHGHSARWIIRPEEFDSFDEAILFWNRHDGRPLLFGRAFAAAERAAA